ncbi:unnamed protein product [Schistosoma turkestanicum]|nr:unnamed protein product [Schistosoma turkestanicum]
MDLPINSVCKISCASLDDTPILRKKTGKRSQEKRKRKSASVFQNSLGHCTKMEAHLPVKSDAEQISHPRRPVPCAALEPQRNLTMAKQSNRHHEAQRRLFTLKTATKLAARRSIGGKALRKQLDSSIRSYESAQRGGLSRT